MTWNHPVYGTVPDDDDHLGGIHPANIERRQQGLTVGRVVPARGTLGDLPPVPQACRPRTPAQQVEIDAQMDKSLDVAAQSVAEWRRLFPEISDTWKNAARFQLPPNPEPGTCWHIQGPCVIEVASGTRLTNPPPGAVESVLAEEPYHLNSTRSVAVATDTFFNEDMSTCPRGAKVQLLGAGGVAAYGEYHGDTFWVGWAPVPSRRPRG